MAKYRVTLSIGYPTATHEDVIDVDNDELAACENEEQVQDLLHEYWIDWSNNYIDGSIDPAD